MKFTRKLTKVRKAQCEYCGSSYSGACICEGCGATVILTTTQKTELAVRNTVPRIGKAIVKILPKVLDAVCATAIMVTAMKSGNADSGIKGGAA